MTIEKPQHLQALERANEIRFRFADLLRDLAAARLTIEQALQDPRGEGKLTIERLLRAQRFYGPNKTREILNRAGVREGKYVSELTDRQRAQILRAIHGKESWRLEPRHRLYAQTRPTNPERASPAAA